VTAQLRNRATVTALFGIALAAFAFRLAALLGAGGPFGAASSYDDGVYFSASALWLRGVLPYRDFVFVHPPGILWFLGLLSWLPDPGHAFAAARVLACAVGAINAFLVGCIVLRAAGPFGGLVAAALYAIYPDAMTAERSAYLEPFLNLACLSSMYFLRRSYLSGFLTGVACAVKLWGGIWIIAAAFASDRKHYPRFIAGALLAGLLLVLPLAAPAMSEFISQTLRFQFSRPPDGTLDFATRVREIFTSGHIATSVLALIGFFAVIKKRERVFAIAMLLTIIGFLASSSYWTQYNAHLAVSQCVLAGFGAAALINRRALVIALIVLTQGWPFAREMRTAIRSRSIELLTFKQTSVPASAFDPTWTLAMHQLPPHGDGAPVIVDSYGAMLREATRAGRFPDTTSAFQSPALQRAVISRLASSDYALLGWRGPWQMNARDRAWFASNFECMTPEAGELCVWKRRAHPLANAPSIEDQTVRFLDGWYQLEGMPPNTWRWMSRRSVMRVPPGRLHLAFEGDAKLTFELDGRGIPRADEVEITGNTPHTLVITADRVFVPARVRRSSRDQRELSVRLSSIQYLRFRG
jgi:hypothetical protein